MRLGRVSMSRRAPRRAAALAGLLRVLTFAGTAAASGTFVQPVHVLAAFHRPTTGQGAYFGWAVSGLDDINGDGVADLIVGEVNGGANLRGRVWVYSGATHLIYREVGRDNDQNGYAIADAGDVN